jgi:predicted membrane-bound dolichyl-phosphate-mannose-protein mannosyltransferase
MKRYKTTLLIAAGIFVFDAFFLNQGAVAILVILLTFFVFVPALCGRFAPAEPFAWNV